IMRQILILTLSFFLISSHAAEPPLGVGKIVPDFSLNTGAGESLNYYADSEDKVSVIIFWATWCPYCRSLMPHLDNVYRKYRSKGVKFYAIDILEDGKIDPIEYFDVQKLRFTLLLEGDSVAEQFGAKRTPGVYVIDKEKKIVYKRPAGSSDVMVKQNVDLRIKQALAK
ncbi:MAG: TlpA disulfide reductase family protein, partial [Pseudomonadota bacterium]